jgi:hypothetical protein
LALLGHRNQHDHRSRNPRRDLPLSPQSFRRGTRSQSQGILGSLRYASFIDSVWARLTATVLDKTQSIYQGRPARLREADTNVPIQFLDEHDEFEPFNTLSFSADPTQLGTPTHGVSTFEHLCRLSVIADRILGSLYAEKSATKDPEELFRSSVSLQADLDEWRESLPPHLSLQWRDSAEFQVLPHTLALQYVETRSFVVHQADIKVLGRCSIRSSSCCIGHSFPMVIFKRSPSLRLVTHLPCVLLLQRRSIRFFNSTENVSV